MFGKNINNALVNIDTETTLVKISGFIGKPEFKKTPMFKALFNIAMQEYTETKMAVAHKDQGGLQLFQLDDELNYKLKEE